jgi:hypothetical protein
MVVERKCPFDAQPLNYGKADTIREAPRFVAMALEN